MYVSKRIGEEGEAPINLGPRINTLEDEMFPYISKDGKLYFSSSGHFGIGGLDLFVAEKRGGGYTSQTGDHGPGPMLTVSVLPAPDSPVTSTV